MTGFVKSYDGVAWPPSSLTWIRQTAGVEREDAVYGFQEGFVGVAEEDSVAAAVSGFVDNTCNVHGNTVVVAVGDEDPVIAHFYYFFSWKV